MADVPREGESSSVGAVDAASDVSLIWAEFAARLRAFAARRVHPGIEPDDVVQEVFLRVVRHLPSLRDAERVDAWLFQIARNTLRDAMRARHRRDSRTDALEEDDLPVESHLDDAGAAEGELASCLAPMVARLAAPYREAIELTTEQGLTQAAGAHRAGISVSGMKSRVQRARDQLGEMLRRCCEIDLDVRRGVTDYRLREPAVTPCVLPGPQASSLIERRGWLAAIHQEPDMSHPTHANTPEFPTSPNSRAATACCGGPAPAPADACCARDAEVKSAGGAGCGCGSAPARAAGQTACCG